MVLKEGRVLYQGSAQEAADLYRESGFRGGSSYEAKPLSQEVPAILFIRVLQPGHEGELTVQKPLEIEIQYQKGKANSPVIGLHIYNQQDVLVAHTSTEIGEVKERPISNGPTSLRATLPARILHVGKYRCDVILAERNKQYYDNLERVVTFELHDPDFKFAGTNPLDWKGILSPRCMKIIQKETR